eukprot:755798-Hanusia_phi.AAC.1
MLPYHPNPLPPIRQRRAPRWGGTTYVPTPCTTPTISPQRYPLGHSEGPVVGKDRGHTVRNRYF